MYKEIHQTFAESEYGKKLSGEIRFGDFKPEVIDNELWINLLGPDVDNLEHMRDTYNITRRFMRLGKMDSDLLKLTAITHDWGEAIVGDMALPDKEANPEHWYDEASAYRMIAENLGYSEVVKEVPEVLYDKQHPLHEPFRVIEFIGYCRTGIRAGLCADGLSHGFIKLDIPRAHKDKLIGGLMSLNRAVELHNYKILTSYMDSYPQIPAVLTSKIL